MSSRFGGKVALVTGAGGGLGSATAQLLAREGGNVVVADMCVESGEATAAQVRALGRESLFIHLDVTSTHAWAEALAKVRERFGRLHVLINNAGVANRTGIREITLGEWDRVIATNLTGSMLGIHSAAPLMRDSGGGAIVNISSTAGLIAYPGIAYAATKWGLRGVTKSAALDLLDWRIRVNSIHPAQVANTRITDAASVAWVEATEKILPMKRQVTAEEVALATVFLASDEAAYINGTELVVDGGAVSLGLPHVRDQLQRELTERQR